MTAGRCEDCGELARLREQGGYWVCDHCFVTYPDDDWSGEPDHEFWAAV